MMDTTPKYRDSRPMDIQVQELGQRLMSLALQFKTMGEALIRISGSIAEHQRILDEFYKQTAWDEEMNK